MSETLTPEDANSAVTRSTVIGLVCGIRHNRFLRTPLMPGSERTARAQW
jgi:hypothetical protein